MQESFNPSNDACNFRFRISLSCTLIGSFGLELCVRRWAVAQACSRATRRQRRDNICHGTELVSLLFRLNQPPLSSRLKSSVCSDSALRTALLILPSKFRYYINLKCCDLALFLIRSALISVQRRGALLCDHGPVLHGGPENGSGRKPKQGARHFAWCN
jgi:hypothetical protein